jgi:hypothetical protein
MQSRRRLQVAKVLRAAAHALLGACPSCGAEPGVNIDCATCLKEAKVSAAEVKKLRVFDCDETLLVSHGDVKVHKPDGRAIKMNSATFAHFKPVPGDKLDFTDFNHIRKPRKIKKTFESFKKAVESGDKVVILTARAKGAESAIKKFLKHENIDPEKVVVVGLGSSDPYDKARWITSAIKKDGYSDVEFYDDSHKNAEAVADYGKKFHTDIHFKSTNVPHPHDEDFEGPPMDASFDSDEPVAAVVEYKAKPKPEAPEKKSEEEPEHEDHDPSDWWKQQSETFQKKYCGEHPNSDYC